MDTDTGQAQHPCLASSSSVALLPAMSAMCCQAVLYTTDVEYDLLKRASRCGNGTCAAAVGVSFAVHDEGVEFAMKPLKQQNDPRRSTR
jgi:hypothetical protein